jgi:hypothetical protein
MKKKSRLQKRLRPHLPYLLLIVVSALIGARPFFHTGLFTAHDIWHQVARLYQYTEAVKFGQLLPTWISSLAQGHGYPLFFFSYHLPWITALPLTLLGMDIQLVLKILFVGSFICSGLAMYILGLELFKNKLAATVASLLYLWAPYHFLTMYVSAAIGTQYQFLILPLLFLGVTWISTHRPRIGVVTLALALAASILSHLMTFVYLFPLVVTYAIFLATTYRFNKQRLLRVTFLLSYSILLGILLSSFYLIPSFYYLNAITASTEGNGFTAIYQSNFVTLKQLIYSRWGFGPIISNAKDGEISFQIGIAQWLAVAGSGLLLFAPWLKKEYKIRVVFFILLFILSIFGMLSNSHFFWEFANQFVTLDYPFRLLIVSVFIGSLLSGYLITALPKNIVTRMTVAICLILVAFYTNRNHVRVNLYTDIETELYVRSEVTTNTFHEYLPKGASSSLLKDENQPILELAPGMSATVSGIAATPSSIEFIAHLATPAAVSLRQFAFPGQTVSVNNQETTYTTDDKGRLRIQLPAAATHVVVQYKDTPVVTVSKILTLLGFILLGKFYYMESKKR